MGLNNALDISVSGVTAERVAMELIASNLANINTTRTIYGGPYRRRVPVFMEKNVSFAGELSAAEGRIYGKGGGVEVVDVTEDSTPFPKVYKPDHPDADAEGFLSLPNVNMSTEMTDMIYVSRVYQANITAFNATKKMISDTLQIQ
jgi:flagellar basal-body rod protein FlgC